MNSRFDLDSAVNSTRRTMRSQYKALATACTDTLKKLNDALADAKKIGSDHHRMLVGEVRVAETRQDFLKSIVDNKVDHLKVTGLAKRSYVALC